MKKPRRARAASTSDEPEETDAISLASEIAAKIDACHAEIQRLSRPFEAEIQRLRELHNTSCASTRRLPAEILCMIFRILVDSCTLNPPLGWINVTHVCRLWRTTAINEPLLWTDTAAVYLKNWKQEMLSRSKTAPLHLKVLSIPLAEQPIPSAVLPFPERLRSLTWCDNADQLFTLVKPAPFLESVNIRLQSAAPLPVDFLGGDAPRLRSFYARNVYVHVDTSSLSNIRILSLGGQWHDPTTTLKLSAFLTFLRRLVHLEELSMDIPGAMEADVVDPSRNIVSHPTKKLDVNANRQWPIVRQFLESIRLDALRDIRVRSNAVYDSRELFPDDILKTILTFFKPGINAKPDTLKTSFSSEVQLISSDLGQGKRCLFVFPLPTIPKAMMHGNEITTFYADDRFASALEESRSIKRLHLTGAADLAEIFGESNFLRYPSLQQLHIQAYHLKPKLRMIPFLKQLLGQRWRHGHKIDELTISNHNLTSKDIKSLSQLVSLVLIPESGEELRVPRGSR